MRHTHTYTPAHTHTQALTGKDNQWLTKLSCGNICINKHYLAWQFSGRLRPPPPVKWHLLCHTHIHTHIRVACPYVTNRKRLKVSSSLCLPDVFFNWRELSTIVNCGSAWSAQVKSIYVDRALIEFPFVSISRSWRHVKAIYELNWQTRRPR